MNLKPLIWSIAVSAALVLASCSNPASGGTPLPTDFYVAFPANTDRTTTPALSLLIAGAPGVGGTAVCSAISFSASFTTDASGLAEVSIPSAAMLTQLDAAENKGIIVHADDAVSIVAVSELAGIMGTYAVPPASLLGQDHYLAAGGATVTTDGGMYMAIVATADDTTVSITPTTPASGHAAGTTYFILLNRGQAYQLQADALAGDMAGTRVTSDKPVALYGGHMCGVVPAGTSYAGFLATPVPPIASAGSEYLTVPLATRSGYWLRILGLHDGTAITYSSLVGGAPSSIQGGQVADFRCTVPLRIASTLPLIVVQMAEGGDADGVTGADPLLSVLAPVSRFATSYEFSTPTNQVEGRYANLVVSTADAGKLAVNGAAVGSGSYTAIGSTGYSSASVPLVPGLTRITGGGASFGAFVYGWAADGGYNGFGFTPGAGF